MTAKDDLDRLLTWYDGNKPDKRGTAIATSMTVDQLRKFAQVSSFDGAIRYRGYVLIPREDSKRNDTRRG